jgi:hypothetical protein
MLGTMVNVMITVYGGFLPIFGKNGVFLDSLFFSFFSVMSLRE